MPDGVYVNTESLRNLSKDLARTGEGVAIAAGEELAASANALADDARQIARSYPSADGGASGGAQAVADSIRVRRVTRHEYRVEAGGGGAPLAGLWELGNKGSDPSAPTFRHKTYGNLPWSNQSKWPYFRMALEHFEPVVLGRFGRLLDAVLRRNRL